MLHFTEILLTALVWILESSNFVMFVTFYELEVEPCQMHIEETKPDKVVCIFPNCLL